MVSLTPVDNDPFADDNIPPPPPGFERVPSKIPPPPPGFTLVSVDHDPFADDEKTQKQQAADAEAQAGRELWHKMDAPLGVPVVSPLAAYDMIRNLGRGQLWGSYIDEGLAALSAGANKLTGGAIGKPYDQAVEAQRAENRASDVENPIAGPVTRVAGGLIGGAPLANKALEGGNILWKGIKSAGLGGAYGGIYGFGEGEDTLQDRIDKAIEGAEWGAPFGAALPPLVKGATWAGGKVRDIAAPTLARWGAQAKSAIDQPLAETIGFPKMSADESAAPEGPGAQAAAEQMLADQLLRSGMTPEQVQAQFANAERSSLYSGGGPRGTPGASYAQNVLAPVDIADTGWQRLAGSAVRANPEAAAYGAKFQSARQTGVTPEGGLPEAMGLPSREPLAPRNPDEPMGQAERIDDAARRALRIEDEAYHGHAATAYKTEEQIVNEARERAQPQYDNLYKANAATNLMPDVDGVMQQWKPWAPATGTKMNLEPVSVQQAVRRMADNFMPNGKPIANIQQFDLTKRVADNVIQRRFDAGDTHTAKVLTDFKNDLLAAVDNRIPAYKDVRGEFSDAMGMRDALRAGADAANEDSQIGADAYKALASEPGKQKVFRLGFLGAAVRKMDEGRLSSDATLFFQKRRIQNLLREIIPRTETPTGRVPMRGGMPAVYSDRPQRFGRYLSNEMRMVQTGQKVFGNSATAERLADDEAFHVLGNVADKLKDVPKAAQGDIWITALNWAKDLFKHFGIRQDEAMVLARELFTADPARQRRMLANVQMRIGRNRYARFKQLMDEHQAQLTRIGAINRSNEDEQ